LNFGLLLRLQRRHGLLAAAVAACSAKNQAATSQVHKLETRLNAPQTCPASLLLRVGRQVKCFAGNSLSGRISR
jgi:hypothetical protein